MKVGVVVTSVRRGVSASSTAAIIRAGTQNHHDVRVFDVESLTLANGGVTGSAISASAWLAGSGAIEERVRLETLDLILLRVQPPVDMSYVAGCQILAHLEPAVRVVNRPSALLRLGEKTLTLAGQTHTPPTIVTSARSAAVDFLRQEARVVLKPLFDYQGRGVLVMRGSDPSALTAFELLRSSTGAPVVLQRYLPEVELSGDKRILMLDGRIVGAFARELGSGENRANLHAGGQPATCDLSAEEQQTCADVGSLLARAGVAIAGIDLIGGLVTEVSITSPTGIEQLRELTGIDYAQRLWEWVESTAQ